MANIKLEDKVQGAKGSKHHRLELVKVMFCHFAENNLTEVLRTATQNLYPTLNFANLLQSMKLSIPIDNTDDPIRYVFLSEYDHTNLATLRVPVYLSLDVRWLSDISSIIPLLSLFELPEWGGLVVSFLFLWIPTRFNPTMGSAFSSLQSW